MQNIKRLELIKHELELKKHTVGYCSSCGCVDAMYIRVPDSSIINDIRLYIWLCKDCYNDIINNKK